MNGEERPVSSRRESTRLRFIVALCIAGQICLVLWVSAPDRLEGPIDVVGYPTFVSFNYLPMFWGYRILVWALPLMTIANYWMLGRRGPLAIRPSVKRPRIPLVDHDRGRTGHVRGPHSLLSHGLRFVPPGALIAITASSGRAGTHSGVSLLGLLLGCAYVLAVLGWAVLVSRAATTWRRSALRPLDIADATSLVNAYGAALGGIGGVYYFLRETATTSASGEIDRWPWVPLWFAVLCAVGAVGWLTYRLRIGRSARSLERRMLVVLIGSGLVFLASTGIPGSHGGLAGFDDMMSVSGADLMTRGYFPWRDVLYIHGPFEDSLRSAAGFALFEHTLWGANAVSVALWQPLCWVGIYLLAAWAAPRRWLSLVLILLVILWVEQLFGLPLRWVFAAPAFILLGEAIRRGTTRWTVALTAFLFVETVLVPEAAFQFVTVGVVLLLSDLVHRDPEAPLWRSLRQTRDLVVTGLACSLLWGAFLLSNGALSAFVRYFVVFGPGHAATGALPVGPLTADWVLATFVGSMALIACTLGVAGWKLLDRRPISTRDWVLLACAIFAGLYGEKGLGRADSGHLLQSVAMTLPLAVLWLVTLSEHLDRLLSRHWTDRENLGWRGTWMTRPASVAAAVALLVAQPSVVPQLWTSPENNKAVVSGLSMPLLGYMTPNALDPQRLEDLDSVVTTLSPPPGALFDFTNSPGYFYYLLQFASPTSFYHVSMAVTEYAQDIVIDEIEETRPSLVAFESNTIGLAAWDGPRNQVRHYAIAQYLLDGWTPVLISQGVLFMMRNDLLASMPDLPPLNEEPRTDDLYFSAPACDWGDVPNYLPSEPAGPTTALEPSPRARIQTRGWSFEPARGRSVRRVLLAIDDRVIRSTTATMPRPDVAEALGQKSARRSGFETTVTTKLLGEPVMYAVLADGAAHLLGVRNGPEPESLRLPGGGTIRVSSTAATGNVESMVMDPFSVLKVPRSVDLSTYELASFSASGTLTNGKVVLSDRKPSSEEPERSIIFETTSRTGSTASVRVGSCLQWHGYRSRRLFLTQSGEQSIDSVKLSGVR